MFTVLMFIFGIIFIAYDVILIVINPGTFLDILTSFSHIWAVLGGYCIFLGTYRKKTGHSFISTWKPVLKKVVLCLSAAVVIVCVVNLIFILNPKTVGFEENDYVILLGGGIDKDGKLPKSVQKRVNKAAEYLNNDENAVCVVTGGTLKWLPYPEAPAIKKALVAAGIKQDRILIEDQALDTIQNLEYSCKLLAEYKNVDVNKILESKVVIVTSRFHLRRAERLAVRMGYKNISGIAADDVTFAIVHNYVREICAYIKLNARILLTGKPKKIYSDKAM